MYSMLPTVIIFKVKNKDKATLLPIIKIKSN